MEKRTVNATLPGGSVDGRRRVIIDSVSPQIDEGRHPIKRVLGEDVVVEADVFADGHDVIVAVLRHQAEGEAVQEVEMTPLGNDRWRARFRVDRLGRHRYTIEAWIDVFRSWARDLEKKVAAGQDVAIDLLTGAELAGFALGAASPGAGPMIKSWIDEITDRHAEMAARIERARDPLAQSLIRRFPDRRLATRFERELVVWVEPELARYGAWYELFPRSAGSDGSRHGTLRDVEAELPRIASLGFSVLYLPPIHPIGSSFRKGRDNTAQAGPGDPGSPWAIGGDAGGHKSVHPELGTLDDFRRLVAAARALGIELALDVAFQCSPDHPYVREHPEWFKHRPDGTVQYAENPPKKYQDIYPFDFETDAWRELWAEAKSIFDFWIAEGITVFRVDNPHTKAFPFWEWCIGELKREHPELILLSEAFTRPKVKYALARLGFTQSYNYFPWRNTSFELREYLTELTRTAVKEYFRPNLWPNTPDILPQSLQFGGRPAFMSRFILAATLGASYGIYGPAFELCVHEPLKSGGEEYLASEKYELKAWNLDAGDSLQPLIARVNAIRRDNPALHRNDFLAFHDTDNPQLLAYSKRTEDWENIILTVVNLDPHHVQEGNTLLDLRELGIDAADTFQVHDLLTGSRYLWHGAANFVRFDPPQSPAAIFRLRRRIRSEQDFDYFM